MRPLQGRWIDLRCGDRGKPLSYIICPLQGQRVPIMPRAPLCRTPIMPIVPRAHYAHCAARPLCPLCHVSIMPHYAHLAACPLCPSCRPPIASFRPFSFSFSFSCPSCLLPPIAAPSFRIILLPPKQTRFSAVRTQFPPCTKKIRGDCLCRPLNIRNFATIGGGNPRYEQRVERFALLFAVGLHRQPVHRITVTKSTHASLLPISFSVTIRYFLTSGSMGDDEPAHHSHYNKVRAK